jgi:hypothetical protein
MAEAPAANFVFKHAYYYRRLSTDARAYEIIKRKSTFIVRATR